MIVRKVSSLQARDTGLAAVLILLLVMHFTKNVGLVSPTIGVLVLTMLWPGFFRPLAYVWFTLANVLRLVVSTILLTAVFLVIATPIGLIRRLSGADPLLRKMWKNGTGSVFVVRDHLFTGKDLERPY